MFKFIKKNSKNQQIDTTKISKEIKNILKHANDITPAFSAYLKNSIITGLTYEIAPIKTFARSFEKVIKEKDGDVSRLKDSYRASVYFSNLTQLYAFIENLQNGKNKDFKIETIEDNFYPLILKSKIKIHHVQCDITSRLYRDIKIIIASTKWHIKGEIQLHFSQYLTVKDETYRLYSKERDLVDAITPSIFRDKQNKKMIKKLLYYRKSTLALNELAITKYNLKANDIVFMPTFDVINIYMKKYKINDFDYAVYDIVLGRTLRKRGFKKNYYLKEFYRNDLDFIKSVIA